MLMNLQMRLAGAHLMHTALISVHQPTKPQTCMRIKSKSALSSLPTPTPTLHIHIQDTLSLPFMYQSLPPPTISFSFTCREHPGGRPSVAPDSWVSPYLYRSNRARLSACVVRRSPHSGRGRRAAGGCTQGAHGPGTTLVLYGSASCCTLHPCWGPPCCR